MNFKRLLALSLLFCLMVTLLPINSRAAETEHVEAVESGTVATVELDADGKNDYLSNNAGLQVLESGEREVSIPMEVLGTSLTASSNIAGYFETLQEAGEFIRDGLTSQTLDRISDSVYRVTVAIAADVILAYDELPDDAVPSAVDDLWEVITEHTGDPVGGDYIEYNAGYSVPEFYLNDNGDYYILDLYYGYGYTFEESDELDQAVQQLIEELDIADKSDYDKVRAIYDWMCLNITYDNTYQYFDAYSALCRRTAVCQGYSSLFYRLCLEVGVDCRYCSGYAFDSGWGYPISHSWNIVCLDEEYYYVDSTWGADIINGEPNYYYLLKGINGLGDHLVLPSEWEREIGDYCSVSQCDYPIPESEMVLIQGSCSDTVSFSLTKAGVLTITGTGTIERYYDGIAGLHHGYFSDGYERYIKKLVIGEGITKIGKEAFAATHIAEVSLPDSLNTLEEYCFSSCNFCSINIPKNLENIELNALDSVGLYRVSVNPDNPFYTVWDGNLVSKDLKTLVLYGDGMEREELCTSYEVPKGIEVIGKGAFFGKRVLTEIVLPETVVSIEEEAFALCSYAKITLPESLVSIGKRAFLNCNAFTDIYLGENVSSLGECWCDSPYVESITVHPNNKFFVTVDGVLFDIEQSQLIKFPAGLEYTVYTIPEGVTEVREYAFSTFNDIETVIFPESLVYIGDHAFEGRNLQSLELPPNLEVIGEDAFLGVNTVDTLVIPDSVKEIGTFAFYGNGAETIVIGKGVEYIGGFAFKRDDSASSNDNLEINVYFSSTPPALGIIDGYGDNYGVFYFGYHPTYVPNYEGWRDTEEFAGSLTTIYVPIDTLYSWTANYHPNWIPDKYFNWINYPLKCYHIAEDGSTHIYDCVVTGTLCEEPTTVTYTCTACGDTQEFIIDENEHAWIDATCQRPQTCSRCGKTTGENLSHPNCSISYMGPVCTGFGYEVLFCNWCGETFYSATNAVGHYYEAIVTEPTCTENGYTTYICSVCGDRYYMNSSGVMQTGWLKDGGYWYYLDANGAMQTGWVYDGGYWYYLNQSGVMQTGWVQVGGKWYYLNQSGVMQTGWQKLNGYWYYLNEKGIMQTGLTKIGGHYYYFGAGGAMQTGWQNIGGNLHLFADNGKAVTGWYKVGNGWYYLQETGRKSVGWVYDGGYWYFMDEGGLMETGLIYDGKAWYYLNSHGVMMTGWQRINGTRHLFGSNGAAVTGWIQEGNNWIYLKNTGAVATGWVQDGDYWFYLDSDGIMQTGWIKDGNYWFYLNKSGVMLTGWVHDGDYWFYTNKSGVMQTGWIEVEGNRYYLNKSGVMMTGWVQDGGYWYYLNEKGAMVTGTQTINGKTYYFNSNGVWIP